MILVDTSVWVDHFRKSNSHLQHLLLEEQVVCHPFVIGEIACGHLSKRKEILSLMNALPKAEMADEQEIFSFVENKHLHGVGIGWVDIHLLASTLLTKAALWTFDKKLQRVASKLAILYQF